MHNDLYRTGRYQMYVKAYCRARNKFTNKVYSKYEMVEVNTNILVSIANDKDVIDQVSISSLKQHYNKIIIEKLQTDESLKKSMSGNQWEIDIIDKVVKIYKSEIIRD